MRSFDLTYFVLCDGPAKAGSTTRHQNSQTCMMLFASYFSSRNLAGRSVWSVAGMGDTQGLVVLE